MFAGVFLALAALCHTGHLYADKAMGGPMVVAMPDGKTLTVHLSGDEHSHRYTTTDGFLLLEASDGSLHYAEPDGAGGLRASRFRASDTAERTAEEKAFLNGTDRERILQLWQARSGLRPRNMAQGASRINTKYPTTGDNKSLVILVEYSDNAFTVPSPKEAFSRMLNEEGYSDNGAIGSARDYFIENSAGKFKPGFDVYGPVKLPKPMAYYGGAGSAGNDAHAEEMIIDACQLLDNAIDFSMYDYDADGYVDNVYVFYAGQGQSSGGGPETVWPHSWDILTGAGKKVTLDGVQLNHYACSNELSYSLGMVGTGTFCHEFSHVLGLPDLYVTDNTVSAFTPGGWSLMDNGSHNNGGKTPPYLSAYERYALGWTKPEEIGAPADHRLESIATGQSYMIRTASEDEYFILENRQQASWDKYIPGHGMLIWHIDYKEYMWNRNTVNNNPDHQNVDIEEADGQTFGSPGAGNAFPGTDNVTSFTDNTKPGMLPWEGSPLNKPITDIEERDGVIYFKMNGGKVYVPAVEALPATDVTPGSFTARWKQNGQSDEYKIDVYVTDGGTREYIDGYHNLSTGNVSQIAVTGLQPGTAYRYVVRASEGTADSDDSNEIEVTTLPPTFEYLSPEALEARDVTPSSFRAQWEAMDGADSYSVFVYTKQLGDPYTTTVDFLGGIKQMPEGWTTNCKTTYASADYSGKEVPALRMSHDKDYIQSEEVDADVRGLSFWYRDVAGDGLSVIKVSALAGGEWGVVCELPVPDGNPGIARIGEGTDVPVPEGCRAVRIEYNNPEGGGLALDDIVLMYGGEILDIAVDGYHWRSVGSALSCEVTGLAAASSYYYRVKASAGKLTSRQSDEIAVTTLPADTSVEGAITAGVKVYGGNGVISVCTGGSSDANITIADSAGKMLYRASLAGGTHLFPVKAAGVYIVKVGDKAYKIAL